MTEKQKRSDRNNARAAQYAEIILSGTFREVRDVAVGVAGEDDEAYATWRRNIDPHLGRMAAILSGTTNREQQIWDLQREVALDLLDGNALGPFADMPFRLKVGGQAVTIEPQTDEVALPSGQLDVVATNNKISGLSRDISDPLEYFQEATVYLKSRRSKGGNVFEGPENYATMLKYFTDKTLETPLVDSKDKATAKRLVSEAMGGFLRISEKDTPNIIEITNILSSIKNLPTGVIEKRYTAGILKHTLGAMDEFSQRGINLLIATIPKLDVEECNEVAGMVVDLALRKGAKFERSGDMLSALRAVAHLSHSSASDRAFTTLLDTRNALEVSSDIFALQETNKLLRRIVEYTTESSEDTKRAKETAEYCARRAIMLYKDIAKSSTSHDDLREAVERAIRDAREI